MYEEAYKRNQTFKVKVKDISAFSFAIIQIYASLTELYLSN